MVTWYKKVSVMFFNGCTLFWKQKMHISKKKYLFNVTVKLCLTIWWYTYLFVHFFVFLLLILQIPYTIQYMATLSSNNRSCMNKIFINLFLYSIGIKIWDNSVHNEIEIILLNFCRQQLGIGSKNTSTSFIRKMW